MIERRRQIQIMLQLVGDVLATGAAVASMNTAWPPMGCTVAMPALS